MEQNNSKNNRKQPRTNSDTEKNLDGTRQLFKKLVVVCEEEEGQRKNVYRVY